MIRFSEAGVCATDRQTKQHLPQSSPPYRRRQRQTHIAADRSSAETEKQRRSMNVMEKLQKKRKLNRNI